MTKFKKITPINGFDASDKNNAMQNNYAWSMTELNDYIYIGTGRNILYLAMQGLGLKVPQFLVPNPIDMNAEIWRYKKDGSAEWEQVYKAPPEFTIFGFRFMIQYTTPNGETALYAGTNTFKPNIIILKSTDGVKWIPLDSSIQGTSTRTMVIHNGKLYMGVLNDIIGGAAQLYVSSDPEKDGWDPVDLNGNQNQNPLGGIDSMASFENRLYIGTSPPGGFQLWRTKGIEPSINDWELVVDKGAGDALNEAPFTLKIFNKHLYLGTGIPLAVASVDPAKQFVPPKGADLVQIGKDDKWKIIAGSKPIDPTEAITGKANKGKYPSGFGDLSNAYIWQMQEYKKEFYLGTFDWSVVIIPILVGLLTDDNTNINNEAEVDNVTKLVDKLIAVIGGQDLIPQFNGDYNWKEWIKSVIDSLKNIESSIGFDLLKTSDGEKWETISINGLGNPRNYGLRTMLAASDGNLYLGTANPFQGCEIWIKCTDHHDN